MKEWQIYVRSILNLAAVLLTAATVGVGIAAWLHKDSWSRRWTYLSLGWGCSFLSGICISAMMLIDTPALSAAPALVVLSMIWGLFGALHVYVCLRPPLLDRIRKRLRAFRRDRY